MLSLGDLILAGLLKFVWIILLQGPLCLLNVGEQALQYLCGGLQWNIMFGAQAHFDNGILMPPSWNDVNIPYPFIGFCAVALVIGLIVFIIQIIKIFGSTDKQPGEDKARTWQAIKMAVSAILICAVIPIFMFIATITLSFFMVVIKQVFQNGSTKTLGEFMYTIGYDGDSPPTPPSDFGPPGNHAILQYNFLVEIVGVWFALVAILIISWMVMIKTVELMFLFIFSPFIALTMPADNGKRMNIWKDFVIAKILVISVNYFAFYLYLYILRIATQTITNNPDINGVLLQFILIAFVAGASIGALGLPPIAASFIGEGMGLREGMSMFRSLWIGSRMFGGFGRRALGFFGLAGNRKGPKNFGGGGGPEEEPKSKFENDLEKASSRVGLGKAIGFTNAYAKQGVRSLYQTSKGAINRGAQFAFGGVGRKEYNENRIATANKKVAKWQNNLANGNAVQKQMAKNTLNRHQAKANSHNYYSSQVTKANQDYIAKQNAAQQAAAQQAAAQQRQQYIDDIASAMKSAMGK